MRAIPSSRDSAIDFVKVDFLETVLFVTHQSMVKTPSYSAKASSFIAELFSYLLILHDPQCQYYKYKRAEALS